jgi:NO-binding membrane sensor protein with MHYT domain
MLPKSYSPLIVILSYVVALLGSYTALGISGRLTSPAGQLRLRWLLGGAFAQGTGIWGMHFTGMLALHLPVPIAYDISLVALSFVVAATGSMLALWLTQRPKLSAPSVAAGGLSIGAAIVGLHYIDMAAMQMPARTAYDPLLVVASIIIAIMFGLGSLWLGRQYHREDPRRAGGGQWIAAAIMAIAIVGMHYTGMAAASFYGAPERAYWFTGPGLPASDLPGAALLSTLLILATALASVAVDRRSSTRALISQRLLSAQENERRRIARVLHEDVGQLLTAVRINLQRLTLPKEGSGTVVGDSIGLVDEALRCVRTLSVELRPSVLDDLGLGEAVAWYANRQAERAGYSVVVEQDLGEGRLPEPIETAGFRIVQQALINVARHARAKNVRVILRRDARTVELVVIDDGIGFAVRDARARSQAGESLGLVDMAELAALAGGSLTITSKPGGGSTVRVRVPMNSHQ